MLQAIDKQLGPEFRTRTQLTAQGSIRPTPSGYALEIDYATDSGAKDQRSAQAETCTAAAQAAALFLALALNPEPEPEPAQPPRIVQTELGAIAQLDTGLLPPRAWGAGLQVGLQYDHLRLTLTAAQWLSAQGIDAAAGELSYWSVRLGVCYMLGWQAFQLGPCLHGELGNMTGYAYGIADGRPSGARVQALTAGGEARVRLVSPLWLQVAVGLEWIQRRPQFLVGVDFLYQPAVLAARIVVGPAVVW